MPFLLRRASQGGQGGLRVGAGAAATQYSLRPFSLDSVAEGEGTVISVSEMGYFWQAALVLIFWT